MQSNHTVNILRQWKSRSKGAYWNEPRNIAGNKKVRAMRKGFFRADRRLTKQDLKILARGNPYLEEINEIELLEEFDLIEEFESQERDMAWIEFEREQEDREFDAMMACDLDDDPDHTCFDEDDNLIRDWY